MLEIRQNLFSLESGLNFASTFAAGLIPSRFTYITGKECALIGAVAGGLTSLSHAYVGEDASTLKRTLFSAGALALTYFSFAKLAPSINRHLMVQLYPAAILQVLAFNAIGHVITLVIAKNYLRAPSSLPGPWGMTDEQIKALHKKYEEDPKLCDKLSSAEQLLLYHRFENLELDGDNVEKEPTKDEINALTDEQIRILHQHEAYVQDDSDNEVLAQRYFNLNLAPFKGIEDANNFLASALPETVEEVGKIKDKQLKWYAIFFDDNPDELGDLPKDVRWDLFAKHGANHLELTDLDDVVLQEKSGIEMLVKRATDTLEWWVSLDSDVQQTLARCAKEKTDLTTPALHPTTDGEVKDLDEKLVRAYSNSSLAHFDKTVRTALERRIRELD